MVAIHGGKIDQFLWHRGSSEERATGEAETSRLVEGLLARMEGLAGGLSYEHEWREGDVIIADNLCVDHTATPESQLPREEVGLRVLHRIVTVAQRPLSKI